MQLHFAQNLCDLSNYSHSRQLFFLNHFVNYVLTIRSIIFKILSSICETRKFFTMQDAGGNRMPSPMPFPMSGISRVELIDVYNNLDRDAA